MQYKWFRISKGKNRTLIEKNLSVCKEQRREMTDVGFSRSSPSLVCFASFFWTTTVSQRPCSTPRYLLPATAVYKSTPVVVSSEIKSYEDRAVDTVVSVLNKAREAIGERQTLKQLAASRDFLTPQAKVSLTSLECPLAITSEQLIRHTIEKKWYLNKTFLYDLKYLGSSKNESSEYFYFEAIFSQPTAAYPIPQATASVFFRVEDKLIEPPKVKGVPMMSFRIEGHRSDHDVRYITLIPDWILAVIQMKVKLFQRIEELVLF